MKLCYFSCHAILEYDELKLFEELGIDFFSFGSYVNPRLPVDQIRPPLDKPGNKEWMDKAPPRDNIPDEFLDQFDVFIFMHIPEWIEQYWDKIKHKRVIWRTIGQSTPKIERKMKKYFDEGLEIVRYSPMEKLIPGFAGESAIIRFYKDPEEFGKYNGRNMQAITFSQDMQHRAEFCNYEAFTQIANGLPVKVFGPKNENLGTMNGGFLSYPEMRQTMRDSAVYIYTGTQPACYTLNFIEAWMTGIPVVAIGPKYGNSMNITQASTYEIPQLLSNGVDGFWSDDIPSLRVHIKNLLKKPSLATQIGRSGRESAISVFGKGKIKKQWKEYLNV